MSSIKDFDYTKVKIKQEKPSPPRRKQKDEIIDELIPKLFNPSAEGKSIDTEQEEKKAVEPIKSSNEILAELFRVFNAAPPESLLNDEYLLEKNKKKHKNRKHKKKSKKRGHDSSDEDASTDDEKRKKKKRKKHKKHKKDSENGDDITKLKKEQPEQEEEKDKTRKPAVTSSDNEKLSEISDFVISSEDESGAKACKEPGKIKKEKENTPKPSAGKIFIKDLKGSKVLEEAARRDKEGRNRRHSEDGELSELSLSDEETYLREREEQNSRSRQNQNDRQDKEYRRDRSARGRFRGRSRDRFNRRWRDSRSRSDSRNQPRRRTNSRSRSRSYRRDEFVIDKKRLLEIARKNAISMFKNGSIPGTNSMPQEVKNKVLMKMRYGGKSVEELTEFCKKLSNGENLNDLSSLSSNEDSDYDKHGNDKAFHHPFVLKDRGPIVMNIKNATPIPPKTADQAKAILLQYPVSSGQQHRLNESEWVPVPTPRPPRPEPPAILPAPKPAPLPKNVFEKPLPAESQQPAFVPTNPPAVATIPQNEKNVPVVNTLPVIPAPVVAEAAKKSESVFPDPDKLVDVTSIIAKRLNAMRKLQENPTDPEALKMMYKSQKDMSAWATSKTTPGQFTGSTGANILTARELTAGQQAWAKKDQLIATTPVSGGMGMHLLQKMGWRPGEGLGKAKNGSLQPLLLEVKMDKRGLITREEDPTAVPPPPVAPPRAAPPRKKRPPPPPPTVNQIQMSIENKHPVSLLGELSGKRKWGPPCYEVVTEEGPSHRKNFVFKVIVNGMMYQPAIPCTSKKEAKALAAKYCLQQLGILPT